MITVFANGTQSAAQGTAQPSLLSSLLPIVLMIAIFYFLLIRPQKKREKETRRMLDEMRSGDEIITIGGIMGTVLNVKDDRVVIETGANKTRITFEKGAIKSVLTVHEDEEDEYEYELEEVEEAETETKNNKKNTKNK